MAEKKEGFMDDFLIAFGALWVVICAYAILAYHIKGTELGTAPPPRPWISEETFPPTHTESASGTDYPREPRRNSRQRLLRCAMRSSERIRSSRR
jgi:hypothetical protein